MFLKNFRRKRKRREEKRREEENDGTISANLDHKKTGSSRFPSQVSSENSISRLDPQIAAVITNVQQDLAAKILDNSSQEANTQDVKQHSYETQQELVKKLDKEYNKELQELSQLANIQFEIQGQREIGKFNERCLDRLQTTLEALDPYITEAQTFLTLLQKESDALSQAQAIELNKKIQERKMYHDAFKERSAQILDENPWMTENYYRENTLLATIALEVMQKNSFAPHSDRNDRPISEQDATFMDRARSKGFPTDEWEKKGALRGQDRWDLVQEVISKLEKKGYAAAMVGGGGTYEYNIHNKDLLDGMGYGSVVRIYESNRKNGHILRELPPEQEKEYIESYWKKKRPKKYESPEITE